MHDKDLVIAVLLSKLGGEAHITPMDLERAELLEIQHSEDLAFGAGFRLRVRIAPVTVEGELADEPPLMISGIWVVSE